MRMLIAEAVAPVRERLVKLANEQPGLDVVGQCSTIEEMAKRLKTTRPQLLIVGSALADGSSFSALDKAADFRNNMWVVLLCDRLDGQYLYNAKERGADYVLESPRDVEMLPTLFRQLVRKVAARGGPSER